MTSVTSSEWDTFWQGLTPDSEIQMWDFYGGRPWILKHTPRWGKVVEAGCGLGRYVFYLHRLGIDVDGFDFHEPTLRSLQQWARANAIEVSLTVGDVAQLPYQDRSLSGYLSFGVVEHFQEGPQAALQEAFRVLRPGGIAIITVPSLSFSQIYRKSRQYISTVIKRLLGRPVKPRRFFQYWYRRRQLSAFVQRAGLEVVLCGGADLFYSMFELGLKPSSNFLSQAMGRLEKSPISAIGAQALTVSIKKAEMMYCFLCGKPRATINDLKQFYLPICSSCAPFPIAGYYRFRTRPNYHGRWIFQPPIQPVVDKNCHYCGGSFKTDPLFEDYGFTVPVCRTCIKKPEVNLELSNQFIQPIWRTRRPR